MLWQARDLSSFYLIHPSITNRSRNVSGLLVDPDVEAASEASYSFFDPQRPDRPFSLPLSAVRFEILVHIPSKIVNGSTQPQSSHAAHYGYRNCGTKRNTDPPQPIC